MDIYGRRSKREKLIECRSRVKCQTSPHSQSAVRHKFLEMYPIYLEAYLMRHIWSPT